MAVGVDMVVAKPPALDERAGFGQTEKDLRIEAFVAEAVVKGLDIGVLPGAAGVDIDGADFCLGEPLLNGSGNELASVVAADILGRTVAHEENLEHIDDIFTVGSIDLDQRSRFSIESGLDIHIFKPVDNLSDLPDSDHGTISERDQGKRFYFSSGIALSL